MLLAEANASFCRTSAYLYVWARRLSLVGVAGYTLSKITSLTANPELTILVEVLSALIFTLLLTILVLQNRDPVALSIRGTNNNQIRSRLGDVWHVLALIYIFLVFVFSVWSAKWISFPSKEYIANYFSCFRGCVVFTWIKAVIDRVFKIDAELNKRFPGLLERSSLYRPIIRKIVDGILSVVVIL